MVDGYSFHWAHDQPCPPWHGPYRSYGAALSAAQRDGNRDRVVYIKSAIDLGNGAYMDTGTIERIDQPLSK